jgi:hypothetical protein
MHDDVVLREKVNVLEDFHTHEVALAKVVQDRVVKLVALMSVVVKQRILDSPWILDAYVTERFAMKNFLAFEEIVFLLVLKSV